MKQFTDGRLTVAYRDDGDGPALVFIHNGGMSSVIWRNQSATLSDDHRVIAIDLPGFGDAPLPEVPAKLDEMVEVVAALIGELAIAPVVLVGNCMGSNIAVKTARAHPELASAVLAVNPLTEASFSSGGIGFLHRMQRVAATPTRLLRSVSRRVPVTKLTGTQTLRFQLGRKGVAKKLHHDPELLACQLRSDQMPALVDVLDDMAAYGAIDREDTRTDVPTRIVWGEQNHVLSRAKAGHLEARLHAERVDVLEGCGHLPMLEDPDAVNRLILDLEAAHSDVAAAS